MEELLDDSVFDPKKLFDKKEFNTLIIGREGFDKGQNNLADLLELLRNEKTTRLEAEEIFLQLKEANAGDMLVNTIKETDEIKHKRALAAAFWESGIDIGEHFLFFIKLACETDYQLALEAVTVIEYCDAKPEKTTLSEAISILENTKAKDQELLLQLKELIEDRWLSQD